MKNLQHQHTLFVLLGGFSLAVAVALVVLLLGMVEVENTVIEYTIIYAVEFGLFCLALYVYRTWIYKVIWFSKAMLLLIYLTLFKIVVVSLIIYIIFSFQERFLEPGIANLAGVMGLFMRGFIIELPCIALAAKLFETDIFEKQAQKNDKVIDNL
ncbi:MAG TPA: hypothetical protein VD905_12270 [Flavobacteriales bacterium]|nr:hypothetical protein [Flavobacteriales bacterium]